MAAFDVADGRLRTPARWRSAPVPAGYGSRPHCGEVDVVHLPLHLWWSGESPELDLTIPAQRRRVFELVLQVGLAEDVERFVDPVLLCAEWNDMVRPAAVIETWQPWIDAYCKQC